MNQSHSLTERRYVVPFVLITTLFFLWGFARAILDVLNKHFQETLHITLTQSTWIQVTTYLAYFLMAVPAGLFISRQGYRRGVVFGLLLFGVGALLFVPAGWMCTSLIFYAYLLALFILGCGLTFLETAANPYSTELGPRETATSRLNLSQSFNGLGSCIAPALVGSYLFGGGSVTMPYVMMGVVVLGIAVVFGRVQLPEIVQTETDDHPSTDGYRSLLRHPMFLFGLFSLLLYEVAEISINSYFISYSTTPHGTQAGLMSPQRASVLLSIALVLFMVGRFVGSALMTRVRPALVLLGCAVGSVASMLLVLVCQGQVSIYALMTNYLFESIMFPTIFSLSLQGLGGLTKRASSLLMMTPVGGCFFLLTGVMAEVHPLLPFVIPALCYAVIALFALRFRSIPYSKMRFKDDKLIERC